MDARPIQMKCSPSTSVCACAVRHRGTAPPPLASTIQAAHQPRAGRQPCNSLLSTPICAWYLQQQQHAVQARHPSARPTCVRCRLAVRSCGMPCLPPHLPADLTPRLPPASCSAAHQCTHCVGRQGQRAALLPAVPQAGGEGGRVRWAACLHTARWPTAAAPPGALCILTSQPALPGCSR